MSQRLHAVAEFVVLSIGSIHPFDGGAYVQVETFVVIEETFFFTRSA